MDNDVLKKLQNEELEILKSFKRVCEKYNISYILSSGTLLGAVRHNGFIPWDDDIDVDMTRENYELFLEHAEELGEQYYIQNWHNDSEFGLAYAKIRKKNTVCREEKCSKMKNNGIYIDIFVCDKFAPTIDNKKYFKRLNNLRFAILLKTPVYRIFMGRKLTRIFKRMMYMMRYAYLLIQPRNRLISKYEALAKANNKIEQEYKYFEHGGANGAGVWVLEKNCFDNTVEMAFEDDFFSVPKEYDLCLKSTYGDYMTLPPENKRVGGHGIVELKF